MGHLQQAVDWIGRRTAIRPRLALILGSGLGGLADRIVADAIIDFDEIPGFSRASASGHRGQLLLGTIDAQPVVAMAGRLHRYEGFSHAQIVFPVHVMAALGARCLIASNAAGGLNPQLQVGDIVVIEDHLDWIPRYLPGELNRCRELTVSQKLNGPGELTGTSEPFAEAHLPAALPVADRGGAAGEVPAREGRLYDRELSEIAIRTAIQNDFTAQRGTYLATLGPSYETRSEYRMMRRLGADVVGMSTVPEALAAAAHGMRVLGLSMVSNVASPDVPIAASHEEVLQAGRAAAEKLEAIVRAAAQSLASGKAL